MTVELPALAAFVFVTTFSPGPNNLASASLGINGGWQSSLPFTVGVFMGFFLVMTAAASISAVVLSVFPQLQPVLRIAGALYIVWLAVRLLVLAVRPTGEQARTLGFRDGLLLQPMNPKVIVFGLTLYSTFLGQVPRSVPFVLGSAAIFALVAWTANNTWSLAGSALTRVLSAPRILRIVNGLLAVLLLFSALDLSGLLAG